jgi:hypothetical protein
MRCCRTCEWLLWDDHSKVHFKECQELDSLTSDLDVGADCEGWRERRTVEVVQDGNALHVSMMVRLAGPVGDE